MIQKTFVLTLDNGMHARPAGLFLKAVGPLDCQVQINYKGNTINGKSIMALISAGLKKDSELEITADGPEEADAMKAIEALFEANFHE